MIIFGSRAAHVGTKQLKHSTCPSCGQEGTLNLSFFRRHAHVFWIPMFPFGKKGVSQCNHCRHVLEKKDMPERIQREYEKFKLETKSPIWQFSGLFLVGALIIFGFFQNSRDKQNEQEYLDNPMIGDVYYQKLENGNYSTMKIAEVVNDSIVLRFNEYEIDKIGQVYKIEKAENYSPMKYAIHYDDLKLMYSDGDIYRIDRK